MNTNVEYGCEKAINRKNSNLRYTRYIKEEIGKSVIPVDGWCDNIKRTLLVINMSTLYSCGICKREILGVDVLL